MNKYLYKKSLLEGAVIPEREADLPLGGFRTGFSWQEMFSVPESIHQDVNFSGYPMGGLTMKSLLFGSVEELCKAQEYTISGRR